MIKNPKEFYLIFLIAFVMILLTYGFKKGLITMSAFLFCCVIVVAAVWLIAFLIVCILLGSIKKAWIEMNPMTMIKELCFSAMY